MPKLLPARFLDKGSKGPAVAVLQVFLLGAGLNPKIKVDGDYGDETAEGVRQLQKRLGFDTEQANGDFGPHTRARIRCDFGIDFDALEPQTFTGETHALPEPA